MCESPLQCALFNSFFYSFFDVKLAIRRLRIDMTHGHCTHRCIAPDPHTHTRNSIWLNFRYKIFSMIRIISFLQYPQYLLWYVCVAECACEFIRNIMCLLTECKAHHHPLCIRLNRLLWHTFSHTLDSARTRIS